jgi:pSer/pThr/pTyr-binding forkhead associated (FHA) protein
LRVLTNEVISINKPVFRVGKERSYVDYFVNNNNAVSRSHADIITRGKNCFVMDLNSKNGTYINNQPIPAQMERQLKNGDTLRLGNEEFIFRISTRGVKSTSCPRCGAQIRPEAIFCVSCGYKIG